MNPRPHFCAAALLAAVLVEPSVSPSAATAPAMTPESRAAPSSIMVTLSPTDIPRDASPSPRLISLTTPVTGTQISSPVVVTGLTTFYPPEATLIGQVRDADGTLLGEAPISVHSPDIGSGGPFDGVIPFTPPLWRDQDGTLEIMEVSPKDGSIVTIQRMPVRLAASWRRWDDLPIPGPIAQDE